MGFESFPTPNNNDPKPGDDFRERLSQEMAHNEKPFDMSGLQAELRAIDKAIVEYKKIPLGMGTALDIKAQMERTKRRDMVVTEMNIMSGASKNVGEFPKEALQGKREAAVDAKANREKLN